MRRLFEEDSTLRQVTTRVRSCRPEGDRFAVVLEEALLYPGGGGQPEDRGTIAGVPVEELREEGGDILHLLGSPVAGEVEVVLDWPRRFDHMQQHTAQHIITATAQRELGLRTTAFHIGETVCDIEFDCRPLGTEELVTLEALVNEHVRELRPVRIEAADLAEVESGAVRSRRLPQDVEGLLRIVTIEGVDRNTCGGTHVTNTGELQLIKILGTERLTRSFRVFYAAGERVRRRLSGLLEYEEAFTRALTCGSDEHLAAVVRLRDEVKRLGKRSESLEEELAGALAHSLIAGTEVGPAPLSGGTEVGLAHHRPDASAGFLRTLAVAIRDLRPQLCALLSAGSDAGPYVLVGPPERTAELAPRVAALLEGRGGGREGLYQGKAGSFGRLEEAGELVRSGR
jgi:misacylated tRNA(Ala) deacylase